jgi:hypothetical protein
MYDRVKLILLVCLALGLFGHGPANALPDCSGTTDTCRTVVSSIDTLVAGTTYSDPQYAYITVTCYHDPSPANAICAGGGDFDRIPFGTSGCTGTTTNGATLIHDHHGGGLQPDCFFRKNFGLNGVVDARQCGVWGDGVHDDGAALNTCMLIAVERNLSSDPPLQNALHIVSTGGGVILDNTVSIEIPANTELTCGGNGTGDVDGNDFRIGSGLTNAIVLDLRYTIALSSDAASLADCNVVAGATGGGPEGDVANPYSPAYWYPDCQPSSTTTPCTTDGTPAPYLRSAIREYSAFNPNETAKYNITDGTCVVPGPPVKQCGPASASVGITVTASQNAVRNVSVLGFGKCVEGTGARIMLEALSGDCWLALELKTPDVPVLRDCTNSRLLASHLLNTLLYR